MKTIEPYNDGKERYIILPGEKVYHYAGDLSLPSAIPGIAEAYTPGKTGQYKDIPAVILYDPTDKGNPNGRFWAFDAGIRSSVAIAERERAVYYLNRLIEEQERRKGE